MSGADRPIKILAVDDHALLREGLSAIIRNEPDMILAGEASDGATAVELFKSLRPDVTLMDLQMPGMSGVETIKIIRGEFPTARIVVLTSFGGDRLALDAIKAGASGYLLK